MSEWTDVDSDEERFARDFAPALDALRARGSACPKPDLVLAQRAGVLPDEIARDVSRHVSGCLICQALADDLAQVDAGPTHDEARRIIARVTAPRATKPKVLRPWALLWSPAPALAALALVVAATVFVWKQDLAGDLPALPKAPAAAAAPVLPLEKAPVRVSLSAALVWRGGGSASERQYLEELGHALEPYRQNDYREAAARLEALAGTRPTPEVDLYLGVSRLFAARPAHAIDPLARAKAAGQVPTSDEAAWYLAVALERAGRADEALVELRPLCAGTGERRAAACLGIEKLSAPGR